MNIPLFSYFRDADHTSSHEDAFISLKDFLNGYYERNSNLLVNYELCKQGNILELAKVSVLLLTAVVQHKHFPNVSSAVNMMTTLENDVQIEIKDCIEATLHFLEKPTETTNFILLLTKRAEENDFPSQSSPVTSQMKRRKSDIFTSTSSPSAFTSPLKVLFDSPSIYQKRVQEKDSELCALKKTVSKNEMKIFNYQTEIELLKEDINSKKLEIEKLEEQKYKFRNYKDEMMQTIDNMTLKYEDQIEKLNLKIQDYEVILTFNKNLELENSNLRGEIESLQIELTENSEKLLVHKNSEVTKELHSECETNLLAEIKELKNENITLKNNFDTCQQELQFYYEKFKSSDIPSSPLDFPNIGECLGNVVTDLKLSELEHKSLLLQKELQDNKATYEAVTHENLLLNQKIERFSLELTELQTVMRTCESFNASLQENKALLECENNNLRQNIEALEGRNLDLLNEHAMQKNENIQHCHDLGILKNKNEEFKKSVAALDGCNRQLANDNNDLATKCDKFSLEIKECLQTIQCQKENLAGILAEHDETFKSFCEDLDQKQKRNDSLSEELKLTKEEIKSCDKKIDSIRMEMQEVQNENENYCIQICDLKQSTLNYEDVVRSLRENNQSLDILSKKLKVEFQQSLYQANDKQAEMQKTSAELTKQLQAAIQEKWELQNRLYQTDQHLALVKTNNSELNSQVLNWVHQYDERLKEFENKKTQILLRNDENETKLKKSYSDVNNKLNCELADLDLKYQKLLEKHEEVDCQLRQLQESKSLLETEYYKCVEQKEKDKENQQKKLQATEDELKQLCNVHKEELENLQLDASITLAENKRIALELDNSKSILTQIQNLNSELETVTNKKSIEISILNNTLVKLNEDVVRLQLAHKNQILAVENEKQNILDKLEKTRAALEKAISVKVQLLDQKKKDAENFEIQRLELEEQESLFSKLLVCYLSELKAMKAEIEKMELNLREKVTIIKNKENEAAETSIALLVIEAKVLSLKEALKEEYDAKSKQKQILKEKCKDNKVLQTELEKANSELLNAKNINFAINQRHEAEVENFIREKKLLNEKIDKLDNEVKNLETELKCEISSSKEHLDDLKETSDALKSLNVNLEIEYKEKLETVKSKNSELIHMISKLDEEISTFESEQQESLSNLKNVEKNFDFQKQLNTNLEFEISSLQKNFAVIQNEKLEMSEEMSIKQLAFKKEIEKLSAEMQGIQKLNEELQLSLNKKDLAILDLQTMLEKKDGDIKNLEAELRNTKVKSQETIVVLSLFLACTSEISSDLRNRLNSTVLEIEKLKADHNTWNEEKTKIDNDFLLNMNKIEILNEQIHNFEADIQKGIGDRK